MPPGPWTVVDAVRRGIAMVRLEPVHPADVTKSRCFGAVRAVRNAGVGARPIMDVNPNRAPWVWVSSDELIAAMRTFDTVENRGYLLVSDVE